MAYRGTRIALAYLGLLHFAMAPEELSFSFYTHTLFCLLLQCCKFVMNPKAICIVNKIKRQTL
jgi:hypothetical protein